MKLLVHILAADIRRRWLTLAAWLALVLATTAMAGLQPQLVADGRSPIALSVFAELLWLTKLFVGLLLVPLIVQTHTLVGTEAYWMTRPIPAGVLLLSKAALVGLMLIVVPLLAQVVLMVAFGVAIRPLAAVTAGSALWNTFWVGLLMAAAVLTRNLTGFALLVGAGLGTGVALLATMIIAALVGADGGAPSTTGPTGPDDPTRAVIWTLLATGSIGALVVSQYRTRWRTRSVVVGAAGLATAFIVPALWPWPLLRDRVELPAWAERDSALRLHADSGTVRTRDERHIGTGREWDTVTAALRIEGVQPEWSARVGVLDSTVVDGAKRIESPFSSFPEPIPTEWDEMRPNEGVVAKLLGVDRIITPGPAHEQSAIPVFFARRSDVQQTGSVAGTYHGRFQVQLIRHQVEAALPLQRGAEHAADAYRLRVATVERGSTQVTVTAMEARADSHLDCRPSGEVSFYLRSPTAREALIAFANRHAEFSPLLAMMMPFGLSSGGQTSGFAASGITIGFTAPEGHHPPFTFDEEWMNGADLVIVHETPEGSVERTLEIQEFLVRTQMPAAAQSSSRPARGSDEL